MLFNSYPFLFVFLPVALFCVYALRGAGAIRLAEYAIIVSSLIFYGWWDWRFLGLLVGSAVFNWLIAQPAADRTNKRRAVIAAAAGVTMDLLVLGFFKYWLFFADLAALRVNPSSSAYVWILPLGISFWTFEQIIYVVDCYVGRQKPLPFARYLLFVTFFPRLIAGPIVRPTDFFRSLADWSKPIPASVVAAGATLVAIGLFKKVGIADRLDAFVTPIFKIAATGHAVHPVDAWAGTLGFTFQIYFDFSGYSDIAIGLALLLGIRLPPNFDAPYTSVSIIEFWRRWHISLSTFLRNYLYVPLGGNRGGLFLQSVNIMITMALGGLWHGAGVNFIIWGLLHGGYVTLAHVYRRVRIYFGFDALLPKAISLVVTFAAVAFAWIFFRADSWIGATNMITGLVGHPQYVAVTPVPAVFGNVYQVALLGYCFVHCFALSSTTVLFRDFLLDQGKTISATAPTWRPTLRWAAAAGCMVGAAIWLMLDTRVQFIYFQF